MLSLLVLKYSIVLKRRRGDVQQLYACLVSINKISIFVYKIIIY